MEGDQVSSEESSKKSTSAKEKTEDQSSNSSTETSQVIQIAPLTLALDETGSFRICTPSGCAKQTADVLKRLPERDKELWCRRFPLSCIERILNSQTLDEETKAFYRDVQRKLKEQ
jgi:hypothetical protein